MKNIRVYYLKILSFFFFFFGGGGGGGVKFSIYLNRHVFVMRICSLLFCKTVFMCSYTCILLTVPRRFIFPAVCFVIFCFSSLQISVPREAVFRYCGSS